MMVDSTAHRNRFEKTCVGMIDLYMGKAWFGQDSSVRGTRETDIQLLGLLMTGELSGREGGWYIGYLYLP